MKKVIALVLCLVLALTLGISVSALKVVPITGISVDNANVMCYVGQNYTPQITLAPGDTTQNIMKYATSNKSVATVSASGVITPKAAGNATITITSSANAKVSAKVNVSVIGKQKNVKLTWYMIGNRQEPDTARVMDALNNYLADKINATIDLQILDWGNYTPKVTTMLSSGQPFDIAFTSNWSVVYNQVAGSGYLLALNDLLKKYPLIVNQVGKDFISGSAIAGKNYAVPTNKEQAHNWGYIFQKSMLDKYKFNIADVDKVKGVTAKMEVIAGWFEKVKADGVIPLCVVQQESPFHFLDWDNIAGDTVPGSLYADNRNNTIINQFVAPESVAMYNTLRDYYTKGYIAKDAPTKNDWAAELKTGKYFAMEQPLIPAKDSDLTSSTGIPWVQCNITGPVMSNRETTGALLAIPAASKNADRAMQFLTLLYTDAKVKNMVDFGIEGVHYTKLSNTTISLTKQGQDKYNTGNPWRFGNWFGDYLLNGAPQDKYQQILQYNKVSLPEKSLGFAYKNDKTETEMSACQTVVQNYINQLACGAIDVKTNVDKMTSELKAAGVDDLIADMQAQYTAWLKVVGRK